ncbi:MAG: hypothetical protein KAV87_26020, partial [Desulfobacteraceae bacterium]|nr:hypothetical protein [Desulfobacteraceae bacterium]
MAKLRFEIIGDTKSGDKAISSTQAKLKSIASTTLATSKQFAKYGSIATGVASAIFVATTKQSLAQIDSLAKTSDKLGLTTEALTAMRHAGELTGVSTNTMDMALQRMTRRLAEAAQGTGEAQKAIKELGLDAQELSALAPDEAFKKISESMKGVKNQGDKVRLAMRFFDSEGVALVNTLALTSDELQQVEKDTLAFGTAVSRVDAAKVEAANDSFERVQQVLKGVSRTITVQLAPILQTISDRFVEGARESGGFSDTVSAGMEKAVKIVAFFADMVRGLEAAWKVAEIAVLGFSSLALTAWDEVRTAISEVADFIPGLEVKPSEALSEWANESRLALLEANDELGRLVDAPMPSTNIEKFFDEVEAKSLEVATKVAETKKLLPSIVEGEAVKVDVETGKVIEAQKKKYSKLREMAEAFQLTEEEREGARFERENEQFNIDLEKLVENGLTVDEALAIQRQGREDAEAIHQENLSQNKIAVKAQTNATILSMEKTAANQALALGDQLVGDSAAGNAALLAIRAGIATNETIINTQVASMRALAELGPILGPPAVVKINSL